MIGGSLLGFIVNARLELEPTIRFDLVSLYGSSFLMTVGICTNHPVGPFLTWHEDSNGQNPTVTSVSPAMRRIPLTGTTTGRILMDGQTGNGPRPAGRAGGWLYGSALVMTCNDHLCVFMVFMCIYVYLCNVHNGFMFIYGDYLWLLMAMRYDIGHGNLCVVNCKGQDLWLTASHRRWSSRMLIAGFSIAIVIS